MMIHTFTIEKTIDNVKIHLTPTLIQTEEKTYLIDCGYEETFEDFVSALQKMDLSIKDIDVLLISHDDIDHLGAFKLFKEANPAIKVLCSAIEKDSVEGKIKAERLVQSEQSLPFLPKEFIPWAENFIHQQKNIKRIQVDGTFDEGDVIDGLIQVVATPGHTKGHVSFYIPLAKTMIANDAIVIEGDQLQIANPQFTLDIKKAFESVKKIKDFQIETMICYHGGITNVGIVKKLETLLEMEK